VTLPDAIRPRRPRRETVWIGAGLMLVLLVVGVAVVALRTAEQANRQLQQEKASEATAIGQLSSALQTTQNQLKQHGVTPSAPPPSQIIQGVPGATGPAGQSIIGPQGPPGKDGVSPDPNAIASAAAKLMHPSPGPQGPAGPAGQPGANSTVPGPQGPAGEQGPTGPPPSSWTWTWTDSDGVKHTYTCTPVTSGSTAYSCQETGTSSPSPTPTPAPSQSAMTSMKAQQHKPRDTAVVSTGPK
jgi:hypothetical protein